jgi:outer membrane protein
MHGEARGADLLDSINAARDHDAAISSARHLQKATSQNYWEGLSGLLPHAEIDGNFTKQDEPTAAYGAAVRRHGYDLNVTQTIFDATRYAAFQRGKAQSESGDIDLERANQTLIEQVSQAYLTIQYQEGVVKAAGSAKEAFQKKLAASAAALRVGDGTRVDVDEAQAALDKAVAQQIRAQTDLDVARMTYARLTGLDPNQIDTIPADCMNAVPQFDEPSTVELAAESNLDVRAAKAQLNTAKADITAAAGGNLPVVNAQWTYGYNWSRGSNENIIDELFGTTSKTRSTTIGVQVTIPLISGGNDLAKTKEALSRKDAAIDALEDAQRKARDDARSGMMNITSGLSLYRARERELQSAQEKAKSVDVGRQVGLRTGGDALDAQQKYFEAAEDLADARYRYFKARIDLSKALGTLDDEDIVEMSCRHSAG